MKEPTKVLVLGEQNESPVTDLLFNLGYVPLVRHTMMNALEKLRHDKVEAVVVDCADLTTDVLEFVLNVRDIDHRVPVVIVDDRLDHNTAPLVLAQEGVFALPSTPVREQLKHILRSDTEPPQGENHD